MSSVMIRNKAGASAVNKEWTGGCVMITYTHPNPDATQVVCLFRSLINALIFFRWEEIGCNTGMYLQ